MVVKNTSVTENARCTLIWFQSKLPGIKLFSQQESDETGTDTHDT